MDCLDFQLVLAERIWRNKWILRCTGLTAGRNARMVTVSDPPYEDFVTCPFINKGGEDKAYMYSLIYLL